jgi:hypothetical protein
MPTKKSCFHGAKDVLARHVSLPISVDVGKRATTPTASRYVSLLLSGVRKSPHA